MKFFLDHDVPADVARVLRQIGYEAVELRNALPVTTTDRDVLQFAHENGFILITCNRDDFLNLIKDQENFGLIVLIHRRHRHEECAHLLNLLANAEDSGLAGNINFA